MHTVIPHQVLACALLVGLPTFAQSGETELPLWELGAFGINVSQQAYPGADEYINRTLALPYFVYRGEFLRAERNSAGLRAIKTKNFELDIGVAGAFGSRSADIAVRRGMPDLGTLVEFGPRLKWNIAEMPGGGRWLMELPLRGVFDLNDRGFHRGMSFEPKLTFQSRAQGEWLYSTSAGAIFADQRLASTLYGVESRYSLAERPTYAAEAGLMAWRLSASASRKLSPDWRLFGFVRIDSVSGAANQLSPLVKRNDGATMGLGITYTWLRSSQSASN
jgi:outer membrane scaffolding protein for murein synthesis (MipA/OmpV family)